MASAVVAVYIFSFAVRSRFAHSDFAYSVTDSRADWLVVLLPTAIAFRFVDYRFSTSAVALLMAAAFIRRPEGKFQVRPDPLLLVVVASAIVFVPNRSPRSFPLLILFIMAIFALRLAYTVSAPKLISSLMDGCGLFLIMNVLLNALGISGVLEGSLQAVTQAQADRISYPLAGALPVAPTIASLYIVGSAFIQATARLGPLRRTLHLLSTTAAVMVMIGSGNRAPLAIGIALSLLVVAFPVITRWLVQGSTLTATFSSALLPALLGGPIGFAIKPLVELAPGRRTTATSVATLESRDVIWAGAIRFWRQNVNTIPELLVGYGPEGQYKSGASAYYADRLASMMADPLKASVHNSFLQLLFDGGLLGLTIFVIGLFWTGVRLARARNSWGNYSLAAIVGLSTLILCSMTEVSLVPGYQHVSYWVMIFLLATASQVPLDRAPSARNDGDATGYIAPRHAEDKTS